MNKYAVKIIDWGTIHSLEDYTEALNAASITYCDGLKAVWDYCGGKLHKERRGYSGMRGNIEYIAYREA